MFDHISISVNNFKESVSFYDETLRILRIERLMTFDTDAKKNAGYGINGKPYFWIAEETNPNLDEFIGLTRGFHIAFSAESVQLINQWYEKCLELGGKDNGLPGPRPEYHPGYYGAFIVELNGYRIEAVLHNYEEKK